MPSKIRSHLTYANVASSLALIGVIGAGAFATAAVVGPDGEVNACYEKKSGDLDVLKGKKCDKGEKTLTWAQEGPPGPQGPQGDPGSAGGAGTNGTPGASGVAGPTLFLGAFGCCGVFQTPGGSGQTGSLNTAEAPVPDGSAFTARSFTARSTVVPGAGDTVTITLLVDGNPTPLSCTIQSASTSCDAPGATTVVPAGSKIAMRTTGTGTPDPTIIVSYGFRGEF